MMNARIGGTGMTMTGVYRIALLPSADEQAFIRHMTSVVFSNSSAMQLTRITSGFNHQLLKFDGNLRLYGWQATVHLVNDAGYDFAENNKRVQEAIKKFGILIGLETYTHLEVVQTAGT
jgi:hypothetical protein